MSTKDYGCFFCSGKSTDPSGICSNCGRPIDISKQLEKMNFNGYRVVGIIGHGFNGWTLKVEDEFQLFAMKVIPTHRLRQPTIPDKEAKALAACSSPPHRNIARFIRQIGTLVVVFDSKVNVLCLVFEYIPKARTLGKLVADDVTKLSKSDVVSILAGIASGLGRMHSHDLPSLPIWMRHLPALSLV